MSRDDITPTPSGASQLTMTPSFDASIHLDSLWVRPGAYGGPAELSNSLEIVMIHLEALKEDWANGLPAYILELESVSLALLTECKRLRDLQKSHYSRLHDDHGIWVLVRRVVGRCLNETANPLKENISQSLGSIGMQPKTVHGFLHLLKGYEAVKTKLHHQWEVLLLLRTALDLEQRMLEAEDARQTARSRDSDKAQDSLRAADHAAYQAAHDLKVKTEQLRYHAPESEPDLNEAISQVDKVHKSWKSKSKNVHFLTRAPANSYYIGQKEHFAEIRKAFEQSDMARPEQKRFVIQGLPGSGKTEMALKYAAEQKWQFWGVFWVDASSKANATSCYVEMAKVFGESETEQAAKQHLGTRQPMHPWLLIIDNADDDSILLEELAPPGDTGYILVTTRNPEKLSFGTAGRKGYIRLSSMHEADATELLLTAAKSKEKALKETRVMDAAKDICHQLHYLPLALVHAGKAICHFFLDMWDYMPYFRKEAANIRERWLHDRSNRDDKPYESLEFQDMDEDDRMSVFASFELLTFRQLKDSSQNDVQFEDAIQLLQVFSFMDFQSIRVDFLIQAALNPSLEDIERTESERRERETIQRMGLATEVSWQDRWQKTLQATFNFLSLPPVLPDALKNPRNMDVPDLKWQVERRIRSALRILASRSLIMRATTNDRAVRNHGMAGQDNSYHDSDDGNDEMRDSNVDMYTMHPLVHQWVRERPSLSVAKQALFCQYALTVLSNSVRLAGGNSDGDVAFRRALKPHIIKALEFSGAIEERIRRNKKRVERDWWPKRWARWATHFYAGPWQAKTQMSQHARFGRVFLECGDYRTAEALFSKVQDYLIQHLGPHHQLAHLARLGFAQALLAQTRRKESTVLLREVHASRLKTLGPKHPQTLDIATELAESVLALGRISESFELCKQALVGLKAAYGEHHRKTIHCVDLIGNVHFFYNDYEECLAQHREALRLTRETAEEGGEEVTELEKLSYEEHIASALMFVARDSPESKQKRCLAEADQLSEHVVTRRRQVLGRHHPYTLYSQAQRGRILGARWRDDPERLTGVVQAMQATLEVARRDLGDGHLGVLAGKKWVAEVLMLRGSLPEAEQLLREATDKKAYAKASDMDGEHPDRIIHVWQLVQCLERMGKTWEALGLCRELEVNIPRVGGHGLGAKHRFNARLAQKITELEGQIQGEGGVRDSDGSGVPVQL